MHASIGRTPKALAVAALLAASVLALVPFYALVTTAFNPSGEWVGDLPGLWPERWGLSASTEAFEHLGGGRALLNSLLIALPASAIGMVICTLAAYSMAVKSFIGDGLLRCGIILAAAISPVVYISETWRTAAKLHLWDTRLVVFLMCAAQPLVIVLLKAAIRRLPPDIFDAARLDGMTDTTVLLRLVVPLLRRELLLATGLQFLMAWNALAIPAVLINSPEKQTITALAADMAHRPWTPWSQVAAMALISSIPAIVVFLVICRPLLAVAFTHLTARPLRRT